MSIISVVLLSLMSFIAGYLYGRYRVYDRLKAEDLVTDFKYLERNKLNSLMYLLFDLSTSKDEGYDHELINQCLGKLTKEFLNRKP